jgi:glycosyltransferase involved in cell wall biosynthesis
MKLAVIIPTHGRKGLVNRLLLRLEHQRRLPDTVIVSAPDSSHVEEYRAQCLRVEYVYGRQGLAAQRNQALDRALDRFDVITFFDDDFLPAADYLALLVDAFEAHPEWAVITGNVVRDGACDAGLTFEDGLAALEAAERERSLVVRVNDHLGAYGCNMSFRSRYARGLRFDERLALYGWQEDIDFTSQLRRHGRIVSLSNLLGVHLGVKSGRVSGLRFGYSQIVNPIYLIRKGTMGVQFGLTLMSRNLIANLARSIRPEPYIDRRGRLRGNLLGIYHVATGRIEPEYIQKL